MSRRDAITMTDDEVTAFLDEQKTVICATNGREGWPHLMPLWFVVRDGDIWAWTFAKSQKIKNLQRDPRATLQVEDGESYELLRGVMLECDVILHDELEAVTDLGMTILPRYGDGVALPEEARAMVARQASKRVGMQFVERRRSTWDHRKLGGVY